MGHSSKLKDILYHKKNKKNLSEFENQIKKEEEVERDIEKLKMNKNTAMILS